MSRLILIFIMVTTYQVAADEPICSEELPKGASSQTDKSDAQELTSHFASLRSLLSEKYLKPGRRLRNRWLEAATHLEEDMAEVSDSESAHQHVIKSEMKGMVESLDKMNLFVSSVKNPAEQTYYENIFKAALSFATVHTHEVVDMRVPSRINLGRYLKILRSIASFSQDNPQYSLYSLKKVIEEEFSLREFTKCKI